jgi:hypothetical protein
MFMAHSYAPGGTGSTVVPGDLGHSKADIQASLGHVRFGQGDIDHLRFHEFVCAATQGKWNGEAKRPCRLHVDEKFELRDLLHRQVDVIGAGMDRSREPHDKVIVLKLI